MKDPAPESSQRDRGRQLALGCLALIFVPLLLCSGLILTFQRSRSIERGFRLADHQSGAFTFDAWGNGEWTEKKDGLLYVSEQSAPFTLLIAIRSKQFSLDSITLLNAKATLPSGKVVDLQPFLREKNGSIVERGRGAISDAYRVLHFEGALKSNESIQVDLELETVTVDGKKIHHLQFTVPGYEKTRNSLYFWEVMMSV